jgi:hypothetical protein
MTAPRARKTPFPSAHEDARAAQLQVDSPQCRASSHTLACRGSAFLLRDELRPVRRQLQRLECRIKPHLDPVCQFPPLRAAPAAAEISGRERTRGRAWRKGRGKK